MNDVLLFIHWKSATEIWSFVRGRIGVPTHQIWYLYAALQLLYSGTPERTPLGTNILSVIASVPNSGASGIFSVGVARVVRLFEYNVAVFSELSIDSLVERSTIPHQVHLWIAQPNSTQVVLQTSARSQRSKTFRFA